MTDTPNVDSSSDIPQVRRLGTPAGLRDHLARLGCELPVVDAVDPNGPLSRTHDVDGMTLHNRFAVLPMEGWDGTADGRPTDLVVRRWRRFGESGAALVWGGEAVAVVPEGRANPNQLFIGPESAADLTTLHTTVTDAHRAAMGGATPVVGLQLTHSGRWSRPDGSAQPRTAYRHPLLDERVDATDASLLTDAELDDLVAAYVRGATLAADAGFDFVDVKHCHGYLLHELLSGHDRPGAYGGSFEGRTKFLREVVSGVRSAAPGLRIGVRLSAFDVVPHVVGPDGLGVPATHEPYRWTFGPDPEALADGTADSSDLTETHRFCDLLGELGIELLCMTGASPYWAPHAQRPAYFPPSDGYLPPRDPLADVHHMQVVTRQIVTAHPHLTVVGSGLTYLQDFLPHAAEGLVRDGWMHVAGIGRMVLSHPTLPARVLAGQDLDRRLVCRTFSDCTTAPRNGLVSGCWPLDDEYKQRPERVELTRAKRAAEAARGGRSRRAGRTDTTGGAGDTSADQE
ncbi:MAG: NADH:flavin oxidoreductase [Actinomycetes bacterium]